MIQRQLWCYCIYNNVLFMYLFCSSVTKNRISYIQLNSCPASFVMRKMILLSDCSKTKWNTLPVCSTLSNKCSEYERSHAWLLFNRGVTHMEYFFLFYIFLYFPKLHLQLWILAPEVLCPIILYIWLQQIFCDIAS